MTTIRMNETIETVQAWFAAFFAGHAMATPVDATRMELKRLYREVFQHPLGPVKSAAHLLPEALSETARNFLEFMAHPGPKGLCTPGAG